MSSTKQPEFTISIATERLCSLLKSNLSCHAGKPLNQELIETISTQIVESVEYFLNNCEGNILKTIP